VADLSFSPGTLVYSTNKTDCHDITEILLKVVLNTTTLTHILLSNKSYSAFCCQKNGLVIAKSCISSRFFVIVALNNNVCLFFGKTLKIVSNCSPKSSSINLSASSSTYKNKQNFKHYLNLLHPNHP